MYCSKCGKELPENAKFCPCCGESVEKVSIEESIFPQSLSNEQKIWLIACGIWLVVWLVLKALIYPDRSDHEERTVFNVIALGVPILATLIVLLLQRLKKGPKESIVADENIPLMEFAKGFDGVRIDKIANKYTGTTSRYFVFSKETRAQFDESLDVSMSAEDILKIKKELWIIKKDKDQLVVAKKS